MKTSVLGPYIIGSALIWGLTIVGATLVMAGVENENQVLSVLSTGAGVHLILIWGSLAAALKKLGRQPGDEDEG